MGESLTRQTDYKQINYNIAGMLTEEYREPRGCWDTGTKTFLKAYSCV